MKQTDKYQLQKLTYLCQKAIMYWRWHSHIEPPKK